MTNFTKRHTLKRTKLQIKITFEESYHEAMNPPSPPPQQLKCSNNILTFCTIKNNLELVVTVFYSNIFQSTLFKKIPIENAFKRPNL